MRFFLWTLVAHTQKIGANQAAATFHARDQKCVARASLPLLHERPAISLVNTDFFICDAAQQFHLAFSRVTLRIKISRQVRLHSRPTSHPHPSCLSDARDLRYLTLESEA